MWAADLVPSLAGKIREAALPPPFGMQLQNKIRAVHRRGRTEMLWATFENSFPYAQLCYRVAQVLDHVPDREPLPHVTLARTRKDFRGRIDDSQFPEVSPVEWEVSGFELWESQLLSHGAHYQVLERFELKRL
jgi:2'-5' RNA ligase